MHESKEISFLRSALTANGRFLTIDDFLAWFQSRKQATRFRVSQIPFPELDGWRFVDDRLVHCSGKFFTIEGIRVKTDYGNIPCWDQPIINQPEIGILGIITKVFDGIRYFLMQAKMEPGNINILQLSPTVQATKSNYTQIHKGKSPLYLEYFLDRGKSAIMVDQLQSEQGSRFLRKRNRNIIVEISEDIPAHDDFCWLTLGQIKQLLHMDNLVNMDARSVLSCVSFASDDSKHHFTKDDCNDVNAFGHQLSGFAKHVFLSMQAGRLSRHSMDEIISWFAELKTKYEMSVDHITLKQMRGWVLTDDDIRHKTGRFFSAIAVSVEAGNREVSCWTQPLLKHTDYGLVGFLVKKINGILHFLVHASAEPGNLDTFNMGPTVACSNAKDRAEQPNPPEFLDLFIHATSEQIRYAAMQSEEGGRFYNWQNRNMILELPEEMNIEISSRFIWLSLGQIIELMKHGYFNIEARNLIACLNLLDDA